MKMDLELHLRHAWRWVSVAHRILTLFTAVPNFPLFCFRKLSSINFRRNLFCFYIQGDKIHILYIVHIWKQQYFINCTHMETAIQYFINYTHLEAAIFYKLYTSGNSIVTKVFFDIKDYNVPAGTCIYTESYSKLPWCATKPGVTNENFDEAPGSNNWDYCACGMLFVVYVQGPTGQHAWCHEHILQEPQHQCHHCTKRWTMCFMCTYLKYKPSFQENRLRPQNELIDNLEVVVMPQLHQTTKQPKVKELIDKLHVSVIPMHDKQKVSKYTYEYWKQNEQRPRQHHTKMQQYQGMDQSSANYQFEDKTEEKYSQTMNQRQEYEYNGDYGQSYNMYGYWGSCTLYMYVVHCSWS